MLDEVLSTLTLLNIKIAAWKSVFDGLFHAQIIELSDRLVTRRFVTAAGGIVSFEDAFPGPVPLPLPPEVVAKVVNVNGARVVLIFRRVSIVRTVMLYVVFCCRPVRV